MINPTRFRFLNETHDLMDRSDWNHAELDKLWLYNLHYFDDLNAIQAYKRGDWHRNLIARWIADNPLGCGNGWEPYPLSLRIVNWIKWVLAGNALASDQRESLAVQARYLRQRLEWHLLGNHLFANAKALVFAGLFFKGSEAEEWLHKGLSILKQEVSEQILSDGGHFERSPMYHSIILEDLLDLINLADRYADCVPIGQYQLWREQGEKMWRWLEAMCHPDGQIAFFNDAAFDIAPAPSELLAYATRLDLNSRPSYRQALTHLSESGYLCWQQKPVTAILDVALIGPDYLPGHAHADTLSFELSLQGQRVIVNSGTSCYGNSQERLQQRGTAAHSTVSVDGHDSSEVWEGFRVARRAYPAALCIRHNGDALQVDCCHDGYKRLPGRAVHQRRWLFSENSLEISDHLHGRFGKAEARFYLHPDVVLQIGDTPQMGQLLLPNGQIACWQISAGTAAVESSYYYPRFGQKQPSKCLVLHLSGARSQITFTWT